MYLLSTNAKSPLPFWKIMDNTGHQKSSGELKLTIEIVLTTLQLDGHEKNYQRVRDCRNMSEMFVFSLLSIKWIKYKGMIGHDKDWSFKLPVPHTQTHRNAGGQTVIHFKVLQYFHVFGEVPRYRHFTPYRLGLKHPVTKKSIYWHILGAILHTQLNCVQRVYVNLNYKLSYMREMCFCYLIKILHARNDLHHRNGKFIEPFNRQIQLKWNINNRIPVNRYASTQ